MKKIIKIIVFFLIFGYLFNYASKILIRKGNSYGSDILSFYNEPKDSIDLVFYGSSQMYATFSPDIIDKVANVRSYNFATPQQPINISYYLMVETLKYQKPKYMVLETGMLANNNEYLDEGTVRTALDKLKFSQNKIEALNSSLSKDTDFLSYYIPLIKYHFRYKEITENDFNLTGLKNRGYKTLDINNDIVVDNNFQEFANKNVVLSSKNEKYLAKIMALAKENDIKLIFVKAPCELKEDEYNYLNKAKEEILEKGYLYIDYNELFKELNLTNGDFYDKIHLSYLGSYKVSNHFANYLLELKNK